MRTNKIPQEFINLAKNEGIDASFATDYFINKTAKKSIDHIKYGLVKNGSFDNDTAASRALLKAYNEYRRRNVTDPDPAVAVIAPTPSNQTYIEQASAALDKIIGKVQIIPPNNPKSEKGRIAVAGDFHFPFVNEKALAALLQDPAETLVIMGDYFDMYSCSRFRQTTDRIRVSEELALGSAYMVKLAAHFKKIYMIKGNHDERGLRRLQETMPQMMPLIAHPVEILAAKFPNVEVLSTPVSGTASLVEGDEDMTMGYCGLLGDCLFGHFEGFCGHDAPRRLEGWLNEWESVLNIEKPRVILQAHIHKLQMEHIKGKLLIGTGCMCSIMPYQIDGHGKYRQPPTPGYVALFQENGRTDFTKTQLISIKEITNE